jgi:hypothetical protein
MRSANTFLPGRHDLPPTRPSAIRASRSSTRIEQAAPADRGDLPLLLVESASRQECRNDAPPRLCLVHRSKRRLQPEFGKIDA